MYQSAEFQLLRNVYFVLKLLILGLPSNGQGIIDFKFVVPPCSNILELRIVPLLDNLTFCV